MGFHAKPVLIQIVNDGVYILIRIGFLVYNKDVLDFGKKILAKRTSWVDFVLMIVWVVLAALVIYEVALV